MKQVLRKIIDNAVPLWYAKDKDLKRRLSRAVAIYAARFLKLYCQWQRGNVCKSCPFQNSNPAVACNINCRINPEAWELPESEA